MDTFSQTARWTAAARARESVRADRLFNDPFAAELAGVEGFAQLARVEEAMTRPGTPPQENPYIVVRTRVVDDFLEQMFAAGVRQVVLVAAGLDARAFRLPWPEGGVAFELDRAELFAYKRTRLAKLGATPRCVRHTIPVDITAPWTEALQEAGFDPARPSAWVVEGLLVYLNESTVCGLLEQAASSASPRSELFADVVGRSMLDSPLMRGSLSVVADEGAPWIFGTDRPEELFARCGWRASVAQSGEAGAQFGRWPFPVLPRNTPGIPQNFFVRARVA